MPTLRSSLTFLVCPYPCKKSRLKGCLKEGRKILVSHTRLFEEGNDAEIKKESKAKPAKKKASKPANNNVTSSEKATLGDLDILSDLKDKMDGKK